jgi:hypothetical protein
MSAVGFLFAEDEAVKTKLSGITLSDKTGANPVSVFYGYPSAGRETRYPFITVDLLSVDHAVDLQSSDQPINVTYWPDTTTDASTLFATPPAANFGMTSYEYVPVWLTYQVMTHTRFAQHDRQLHGILLATNRIPFRWGYLQVPADGTTRRWENLNIAQSDTIERTDKESKRIWRKAYTVRCNAELTPFALQTVQEVATVDITLQAYINSTILPPNGTGSGPYPS